MRPWLFRISINTKIDCWVFISIYEDISRCKHLKKNIKIDEYKLIKNGTKIIILSLIKNHPSLYEPFNVF